METFLQIIITANQITKMASALYAAGMMSPKKLAEMEKLRDDLLEAAGGVSAAFVWSDDHDDEHEAGDLARAGAAYAIQAAGGNGERLWPFVDYWKPSDTRSNLVKAAALIIAEIDKHDRAETEGGE